ncbi:PCP reductase family protein [Synechococcus sp. KORDI-100]|uniref:PCP reductase family protein n=1 Tax=Synechococcus sp. KORDI-100 TaxID=1280380 RepID=UPI00350FCFBB
MVKPMDWQVEAQTALKKDVPFFVRGAVKKRIEAMAAEEGLTNIDLSFYHAAKKRMAPQ